MDKRERDARLGVQMLKELADELGTTPEAVVAMDAAQVRPAIARIVARHERLAREHAREAFVAERVHRLMELGGCPEDMTIAEAVATGRISQDELDRAMNPTEEQVDRAMRKIVG